MVNERSDGRETVMVDHGCDNGRLFCVLLTRVENLSSLRGRKTNEGGKKKKKTSRFAILQSLVLLCDVLTEGSGLAACGSGSQSRGSRMPKNPSNPLSSTSSSLVHTTQRCSRRYTGALLCIPAVFSDFRGYSNA